MAIDPFFWITRCWIALGCIWLVGLVGSRRVAYSQPWGQRIFHLGLSFLGFYLLIGNAHLASWMETRVYPRSSIEAYIGLVLTCLGCAFAAWARVTLGENWSAPAVLKEHHELVTVGPYKFVRHPIYAGLLLGCFGTAMAEGKTRSFLALAVIFLALAIKASQEEPILLSAFPQAYGQYQLRVKALIPGLF